MQNIGYIIDKLFRSPIYNLVIHWISCRPFEQPGLVLFWWNSARRPVECVPCPRKHESGFVNRNTLSAQPRRFLRFVIFLLTSAHAFTQL